jgi:predicted Zn-ribbon and HTH transcriptional regulator
MFFRTKKSVLEQLEKEDAQLASILRAINELYKMANFKLSYVNNLLRNYNVNRFYSKKDESKKFLESNTAILEKLEDLISSEKKLESDEKYRKHIFAREIENLDEALKLLKKIRHLIKREINLIISLKKLEDADYFDRKKQFSRVYRIMSLIAKCVKREVNLLEIESSKITKVDQEIKRLDDRIKKNRRMPIVKSRYYHASPFIFNVGDKIKPSGPRERNMKIENIFEDVRKREFPNKPSRMSAIYVDTDARGLESYGLVYAVEVRGNVHRTDQEQYTEASFHPEDAESWARSYWEGGSWLSIPEVIVNGKVTVIGLADYVKVGDKIQIIVSGLEDDDGNSVPKGSVGVIDYYDKYEEDLPFVAKMSNGSEISLPPTSFKVIK